MCGFASISYDGEHASETEDLPHVQMSDGEGACEPESRISCVQSGVCGDGASEPEVRSHVQRADGDGASEHGRTDGVHLNRRTVRMCSGPMGMMSPNRR